MTESVPKELCSVCGKDTKGITVASVGGNHLESPVCMPCGTKLAVGVVTRRPGYDPKKPVRVHASMRPK